MRKPVQRRSVDYTSSVVRFLENRLIEKDIRDSEALQPTPAATINLLPSSAYLSNPISSFCTKFVHQSTNKVRCSINRVLWTPNGRRLMTGSDSGEFTLWNGQSFNFEMILQAHDVAIRSMVWSHNENLLVTGDHVGCIKYWQSNMNNVKANKIAHKEPVRDLGFSCTDLKFCSCSDDKTVKVWDFARCQEEMTLTGHRGDVLTVDWHPQKSILASGSKDYLVKVWDAKSGKELSTLHGHKNTVLSVKWNQNGNWLLTASKDNLIKLYDIRTLKEIETFKGHKKEVTALAWHPYHEEYFVSGGYDGAIIHWLANHDQIMSEVSAHENSVWDLSWHPMGHILCSGSNDKSTKFWCRNRPGDFIRDKMAASQVSGDFYGGNSSYPTYNMGSGDTEPDFSYQNSMPGMAPTSNMSQTYQPPPPGSMPHVPRLPTPPHGNLARPYPNQTLGTMPPSYPPPPMGPYRPMPPYGPPMGAMLGDFRAPMMPGGQPMMRQGGQVPGGMMPGYSPGSGGPMGRPAGYGGPQMGMGQAYAGSSDPRLGSQAGSGPHGSVGGQNNDPNAN